MQHSAFRIQNSEASRCRNAISLVRTSVIILLAAKKALFGFVRFVAKD
jgi:hypothetical protein